MIGRLTVLTVKCVDKTELERPKPCVRGLHGHSKIVVRDQMSPHPFPWSLMLSRVGLTQG